MRPRVSEHIPLIVHVSDEAGVPDGGGSVSAVPVGMLETAAYAAAVGRTLVAGPLPSDAAALERLTDPTSGVQIAYSSRHGIYHGVPEGRRAALAAIEQHFGVALLYGTRRFGNCTSELLLVDAAHATQQEADQFKALAVKRQAGFAGYTDRNPSAWRELPAELRERIERFNALPKERQAVELDKMQRELADRYARDPKEIERSRQRQREQERGNGGLSR